MERLQTVIDKITSTEDYIITTRKVRGGLRVSIFDVKYQHRVKLMIGTIKEVTEYLEFIWDEHLSWIFDARKGI